jgi:MFS transporter, FHS family, L-fucose permease
MRINLSQAFNGIGTVIAPVLGSYVIFVDIGESEKALKNVQWIYLAIACFCILLAVVFLLYVPYALPQLANET